jgi:hypothetical protein
MSFYLAIPEDKMKVFFSLPISLLFIMLTESRYVFVIVTHPDQENNNKKHPEISNETIVLGKAIEDNNAVTYQELRNISITNKRNQMKRRKGNLRVESKREDKTIYS